MALIVVGGQAKNVGKTTLVCNIIAAFPGFHWTAVKVSTHAHELANCELQVRTNEYSIWRETRRRGGSDTARFLDARATNAFIVEAETRNLRSACEELLQWRGGHTIVESTAAAEFLHPALFLLVLKGDEEFKQSAMDQLQRADALVLRGKGEVSSISQQLISEHKPLFEAILQGLDPRLYAFIGKFLR